MDARELVVHRLESQRWVRVAAYLANEPGLHARIEPFDQEEVEVATLFGDDPSE